MTTPALEMRDIEKRFYDFRALRSISLHCDSGEVLGLVGENGAGKSTLLNVIGGVFPPDAGSLRLLGTPYAPRTPSAARAAGVAFVHQEPNLFGNLSIAENVSLGALPKQGFWIDRAALRRRAVEALREVDLDLAPEAIVDTLSPGERQLVEIAKASMSKPRLILLDEPTSSLAEREVRSLFELIENWKRQGVAVIYVSHNLDHVQRLCDRVAVLRDGEVQAVGRAAEFNDVRLIPLMVGRAMDRQFPPARSAPPGDSLLEVRHLGRAGAVQDVSFTLHRGEVLGLAGLMGAGRTELARMIFGLDDYDTGSVLVSGRPLPPGSARTSVASGLAFVSEDRHTEGLLLETGVADNMAIASLDRFAEGPLRSIAAERVRSVCHEYMSRLGIACQNSQRQAVKTLSGGNQQKVVLARWLMRDSQVLILDEPTRGVDVGARQQVYEQIAAAAERGAGVLVISSEIEELLGLCDRILVMSAGAIQADVRRADFDRHKLMAAAFSQVA